MSQKWKQSFKGRQCGRAPDGWFVYAGGKAIIQRIGKGEAFTGKSCHDSQQRKNASQEGPVEISFSISLSPDYLDSLFICFQLRKHSSVFGCQRNCHFKKGKIQWTPCCRPGNLDMSCYKPAVQSGNFNPLFWGKLHGGCQGLCSSKLDFSKFQKVFCQQCN